MCDRRRAPSRRACWSPRRPRRSSTGATRCFPRRRPSATAAKAQNTQLAAALLLPLFAYKVGAVINGVKLQWYLDATIAFAAVSLVVFASK